MISQNAIKLARTLIEEGQDFYQQVYKDSRGFWTIGIGHKLHPNEIGKLKKVTYAQAVKMLEQQMSQAIAEAKSDWGDCLNSMNAQRTAVILDMTYNLGSAGIKKFVKMAQAIQNKDWSKASVQILDSAYAKQVGNRARRNAQIMKDGKMHSKTEWES